jgi:hypothetical protein
LPSLSEAAELRQVPPARLDLLRMGGWSARASAWIATFGVICFVARFGPWKGVIPFGWLNDVSSLLQYLLAIPVALALHEILDLAIRAWPLRPRSSASAGCSLSSSCNSYCSRRS